MPDIEGQLRNTIISRMTGAFAESGVPFLDMAANQTELGVKIGEGLKPMLAELGLGLDSFVVENLSLPDELQKMLDTRVGMNMIGDMNRYTQFQVANSMPIAAGERGRRGRSGDGRRIGRGARDGAADDECHAAAGSWARFWSRSRASGFLRSTPGGGSTFCGSSGSRTRGSCPGWRRCGFGGRGHEVLRGMRQADPPALEVLPGVRRGAVLRRAA